MNGSKCLQCGAATRPDRPTCGRCGTLVAAPTPAHAATPGGSRRPSAALIAAVGVIVMAAGIPFVRGGGASPAGTVTSRPDPFASRRQTYEPAPAVAATGPVQASDFMDAHDEGAVAYAGGNYANAAERYQAAIAKNPDDAESLSNLGQVLVREGKAEEALPYFDRAIAIIPQRWAYRFNRARALGIVGRTADAVAGYRDAQRLFPDDYATAFNLGLALHKLGDEAAAVEAFQKAIQLDPNDASFRMALGTSFERLQRPRDAAAAFEEYLRLAPSAPDATAVRARITQLTQGPAPVQPGT